MPLGAPPSNTVAGILLCLATIFFLMVGAKQQGLIVIGVSVSVSVGYQDQYHSSDNLLRASSLRFRESGERWFRFSSPY